ncbi:hypothetical protein BDV28DRAFT_93005 [Aspergillus coremiiformis]|uniref:DUF2293 domain-containing protein n=1 Tax=Aspergillus coremiiformis TaxID=138285 RepID=A0A5N6YSC9_9EURO|nr:hypothetical protein BDV28DRAFT_93005 [Aspergillus coremiiformis]
MHIHNLSQHVHRIGYHFPSAMVATVCMDFGLYLTPTGKAVPFKSIGYTESRKRTNSEVSQTTINTEARDVLKDLFPNIPDNDLNQIIKTAFQKGQRKVGTAVELPLARRAQLAVVAHIRHVYTDYDRLLKTTSFHEARSIVEEPTLAKLVEWRGDDENGRTILEDVFREVIVISDDEGSDTEGDVSQPVDRHYSMEIFSSHPRTDDLQMRPVNSAHQEHHLDISDVEGPSGFHFVPVVPRKAKIDRRGFSRYQAWDRAINRYRNGGNEIDPRNLFDDLPAHGRPIYAAQQPLQQNLGVDMEPVPLHAIPPRQSFTAPYGNRNTGPNRSTIGTVIEHRPYEVYPMTRSPRREAVPEMVPLDRVTESQGGKHSFEQNDSANAPVFVSGPKNVLENSGDQRESQKALGPFHSPTGVNPQERVLPSIESPLSPENEIPDSVPLDLLSRRISGEGSVRSVTPYRLQPKDIPHPIIEEGLQDQLPKRRRVAYYDTVNLDRCHSRMASNPNLAGVSTGERYISLGYPPRQSSVQNGNIRRSYLAPIDPVLRLRKFQVSNSSAARFNRESGIIHPENYETLGAQPPPRNRPLAINGWWKSPERSYPLPDARITVPTTYGSGRAAAVRSSDLEEQRAFYQDHHSDDSTKPLEVSGSRTCTWANTNDHILMPHENTQRRMHYADDFVRTIDSRAPIPMGHLSRHHLHTNFAREPLIQRTYVQLPHDPSNYTGPGSISPSLLPSRDPMDSRVKPTQRYATMDMKYPNTGLIKSASAVGDSERRFQNSLQPSRYGFGQNGPFM